MHPFTDRKRFYGLFAYLRITLNVDGALKLRAGNAKENRAEGTFDNSAATEPCRVYCLFVRTFVFGSFLSASPLYRERSTEMELAFLALLCAVYELNMARAAIYFYPGELF